MSPDKDSRKNKPVIGFKLRGKKKLRSIASDLSNGNVKKAQNRWLKLVKDKYPKASAAELAALVQIIMREAYKEVSDEMRFHAERIEFYNELAQRLRDELAEIRRMNGSLDIQPVRFDDLPDFEPGAKPKLPRRKKSLKQKEVDLYIKDIENELAILGDNAHLSTVELQTLMKEQRKAMAIITRVTEQMHNTAMKALSNGHKKQ